MVYVDKARHRFGRMIMCHMIADNHDELHEIAEKIGLSKRWFQNDKYIGHYDICESMKTKALKLGAVEIENKKLASIIKKVRGLI